LGRREIIPLYPPGCDTVPEAPIASVGLLERLATIYVVTVKLQAHATLVVARVQVY
jgi:hypothetical protein